MTRYQPRSLAPLNMPATPDYIPFTHPIEGKERAAAAMATYAVHPYDPAVDAVLHGLMPASVLSGAQIEALQQQLARHTLAFAVAPRPVLDLPIGMIEPPAALDATIDATAALSALAEAEAAAHALVATVPRRPTLLRRLVPTSATAFWMAVSGWLGFLLARAEGWL